MNRIVNAIKLGKFSKRNLAMGLMGGLLIAAIIFLPEIISWVGKRESSIAKSNNGLNGIFSSFNSEPAGQLTPSGYHEPISGNVTKIAPGDGWADDPAYDIPQRPRLSRDQHRNNIARAKQESILFAKKLGVNNSETKFALFDFANTLGLVLSGTAELFNGTEIYDYVVGSRAIVVRHIRDEKVNREIARNWNAASLSAVDAVDFLKCDIALAKPVTQEEPKLTIPSDPTLKRRITPMSLLFTRFNRKPNNPYWIEFAGYVPTREKVLRIDILRGDKKAGHVYVDANGNYGTNYYFRSGDLRGPHTLRVVFDNGDFFERTYDFTGNAQIQVVNPDAPVTLTSAQKGSSEPVFKEL